jgi:hypothetical protein
VASVAEVAACVPLEVREAKPVDRRGVLLRAERGRKQERGQRSAARSALVRLRSEISADGDYRWHGGKQAWCSPFCEDQEWALTLARDLPLGSKIVPRSLGSA